MQIPEPSALRYVTNVELDAVESRIGKKIDSVSSTIRWSFGMGTAVLAIVVPSLTVLLQQRG